MIGHILERAIIHFFSSAGVYRIALAGFWLLSCRWEWWKVNGPQGWMALIWPAVISFIFISFREIFDVSAGGAVIKSICDWISWIVGLGTSVYEAYNTAPRIAEINQVIKTRAAARKNEK